MKKMIRLKQQQEKKIEKDSYLFCFFSSQIEYVSYYRN